MKDETQYVRRPSSGVPEDEIRRLARTALTVLAGSVPTDVDVLNARLADITTAFIAPDEEDRHQALLDLRQDGIDPHDIIDHVIPAAARLLGEQWMADTISFAHVTIGAARMQETVHALSIRPTAPVARDRRRDVPTVLLIVPRGEQHTLGPCVLADQFRRLGYRAVIMVDSKPDEIVAQLRTQRFALVGISVGARRTLASVKDLVELIASVVTRVTPVVLGGASLDRAETELHLTGAHGVARDAREALRVCGLPVLAEAGPVRSHTGGVTA